MSELNGAPLARVGDTGFVHWPENSRVHATPATVREVLTGHAGTGGEPYYVADVPAAASGTLRLLPHEFRRPKAKPAAMNSKQAKEAGYTGDPCGTCGALTMTRNGNCTKCDTCGSTSGCS